MNARGGSESSVYQVYPAGFKDINGDGVGDSRGISSEADYIRGLCFCTRGRRDVLKSPVILLKLDLGRIQ